MKHLGLKTALKETCVCCDRRLKQLKPPNTRLHVQILRNRRRFAHTCSDRDRTRAFGQQTHCPRAADKITDTRVRRE